MSAKVDVDQGSVSRLFRNCPASILSPVGRAGAGVSGHLCQVLSPLP
jgi:hypothetical protein